MGKQRRKVRIPAIGSHQKTQTTLLERSGGTKPQEIEKRLPWSAEYILQQYYKVTIDEQRIETEWLPYFRVEDREQKHEDVLRFQRMLRSIVADQKALDAVCKYLVVVEQDSMGDDASTYRAEYYEGEKSFVDILVELVHCFTSEDREWLLKLVDLHKENDFDLDFQAEGLRVMFRLQTSGFHVGQHACRLENI